MRSAIANNFKVKKVTGVGDDGFDSLSSPGWSPSWKRRGLLYPDSGCSAPAMTTVMVMASPKSPRTISANGNQNHFSQ